MPQNPITGSQATMESQTRASRLLRHAFSYKFMLRIRCRRPNQPEFHICDKQMYTEEVGGRPINIKTYVYTYTYIYIYITVDFGILLLNLLLYLLGRCHRASKRQGVGSKASIRTVEVYSGPCAQANDRSFTWENTHSTRGLYVPPYPK